MSLVEAVANVVVGLLVAVATQIVGVPYPGAAGLVRAEPEAGARLHRGVVCEASCCVVSSSVLPQQTRRGRMPPDDDRRMWSMTEGGSRLVGALRALRRAIPLCLPPELSEERWPPRSRAPGFKARRGPVGWRLGQPPFRKGSPAHGAVHRPAFEAFLPPIRIEASTGTCSDGDIDGR